MIFKKILKNKLQDLDKCFYHQGSYNQINELTTLNFSKKIEIKF